MRMKIKTTALAFVAVFALAMPVATTTTALAQEGAKDGEKQDGTVSKVSGQDASQKKDGKKKGASKETAPASSSAPAGERLEPDDKGALPADVPQDVQAGRREQMSEDEAAVLPYYNNFLKDYRLGPEDVISVEVFNQPRYSKSNITVPPNGRISYYLIPEGVLVVGKTTQQVQDEITKKLDEYIIDPQVTVSLEKAMSARYSVLGDVGTPGVKIMTRRVSVYEAIAEAGGVLNTGDKKKVVILRRKADGNLYAIPVNIKAIERGEAKEMAYLVPGDQVVVPGNRLKSFQQLMNLFPILSFGRIFGLPF